MYDFFASFVTYIWGSHSNSSLFLASRRLVGNMVFLGPSAERFCSNFYLLSGSLVWYAGLLHEDAAKAGKIGSFTIEALLSH
jgi:hypothetical protein